MPVWRVKVSLENNLNNSTSIVYANLLLKTAQMHANFAVEKEQSSN